MNLKTELRSLNRMRLVNTTIACQLVPETTLDLKQLPLVQLYSKFPGARKRFTNCTAMIFESGKINLLGINNIAAIDDACQELQDYLQHAGYHVRIHKTITNMVIVSRAPTPIKLAVAYAKLKSEGYKCMLELELFPALRVWHGWTGLIYTTGTVIVTGLKGSFEESTAVVTSLISIVSSICDVVENKP